MTDYLDENLLRRMTGKTSAEMIRREITIQDYDDRARAKVASDWPIIELGRFATYQRGGTFYLTEEQRLHAHIIGASGQGKSRLLQLFLRHHMRQLQGTRGMGACLIDSSENGDTAKRLLKYAQSINFPRICLIDPEDITSDFAVTPILNLVSATLPPRVFASQMIGILSVLFPDIGATRNIEKYLESTFIAIREANGTLADIECFTSPNKVRARDDIISRADSETRATLTEAFRNNEYHTTITRLRPLTDQNLLPMFGSHSQAIDFDYLVKHGYIILVNLDVKRVLGSHQSKILGTIIINQIIESVSRLTDSGEIDRPFHLYIDEAGDYDTPRVGQILDKNRKSGAKLTLCHQHFKQFSLSKTLSALLTNANVRFMFNCHSKDRRQMLDAMEYPGDVVPDKQQALVQVSGYTELAWITGIDDVPINQATLDKFKKLIYTQPWYRDVSEVRAEINERFTTTGEYEPLSIDPQGSVSGRPQSSVTDDGGAAREAESLRQRRAALADTVAKIDAEKDLLPGFVSEHKANPRIARKPKANKKLRKTGAEPEPHMDGQE